MTFDELSEAIYECRKAAKGDPVQRLILRRDVFRQLEAQNEGELTYRPESDERRIMGIPVSVAPESERNEVEIVTRNLRSVLRDGQWHDTRYEG